MTQITYTTGDATLAPPMIVSELCEKGVEVTVYEWTK